MLQMSLVLQHITGISLVLQHFLYPCSEFFCSVLMLGAVICVEAAVWAMSCVLLPALTFVCCPMSPQTECHPDTCTQMTATEQWIFLCAAHKTPKEVRYPGGGSPGSSLRFMHRLCCERKSVILAQLWLSILCWSVTWKMFSLEGCRGLWQGASMGLSPKAHGVPNCTSDYTRAAGQFLQQYLIPAEGPAFSPLFPLRCQGM